LSVHDEDIQPTPPVLQPTPVVVPPAVKAERNVVMILALVIAGQTLAILLLAGALVFSAVFGGGMGFGMPSSEMESAMMAADDIAYQVGECLIDNDEQAYLALFVDNDEHVDLAEVRDQFAEASGEATQGVEYMCDSYTLYEDADTGESIVKAEASGFDYESGNSFGGSITLYVNVDEMKLTGIEGRSLDMLDTF